MAKYFTYLLIHHFLIGGPHVFFNMIGHYSLHFLHDGYLWIQWWFHLMFLFILYYVGKALTSVYQLLLLPLDIEFIRTGHTRFKSQSNCSSLLTMDGRLCVFTDIINIFSHSLAYLRRFLWSFHNCYGNSFIISWNKSRNRLGTLPPFGWPLQVTMTIFAIMTTVCLVIHDYYRCLLKLFQKTFRSSV